MTDEELTPGQVKARDALHETLRQYAKELGPNFAANIDEGQTGTFEPSGWVLMAVWTRLEDGEQFTVRMPSEKLGSIMRVGLLHEGLYGFDD